MMASDSPNTIPATTRAATSFTGLGKLNTDRKVLAILVDSVDME